jgi:hypothetical protein
MSPNLRCVMTPHGKGLRSATLTNEDSGGQAPPAGLAAGDQKRDGLGVPHAARDEQLAIHASSR